MMIYNNYNTVQRIYEGLLFTSRRESSVEKEFQVEKAKNLEIKKAFDNSNIS